METKIKVINMSKNPLPAYSTAGAVGMDLRADIAQAIILEPMARVLVPTGLRVEIPVGFEIQIRPRSGLAAKYGVTVLNTPGTIDPDFRGEIKVILVNLSSEAFTIEPGERVAQAVLAEYRTIEWQPVQELEQTERCQGGFGSTGVK